MIQKGFLGIDAGTQGLSVIFTDEEMKVVETGDGSYEMVAGLGEGCYEQNPGDWERAASVAMDDLRRKLAKKGIEPNILAIGISGQMHGEVLADEQGMPIGPARLWCDSRNEAEGNELTEAFGTKMPKRITAARWLWTTRNRSEWARRAKRMTTPGGWLAFRLTGQWNLGIGDAAGMFPIDQTTMNFDELLLDKFNSICGTSVSSLKSLLPKVCKAGEDGGQLNEAGARLLRLPVGIPVAPAEGDQPAALAGSLIGSPGMVSMSFGTSVCANSVGDRPFQGVSRSIDHFCAADGRPINMVWLRNGTTFMNTVVEMFGEGSSGDRTSAFRRVMPQVLTAPADCGGLLALPFMDDEPGLGISRGGSAMLYGLSSANANAGNAAKAAILATMFNLRIGAEALDQQNFPRTEINLSGGLTKTPELGQLLADVFNTPVKILDGAAEGSAWGASLLAKFRYLAINGSNDSWPKFLAAHNTGSATEFKPNASNYALLAQSLVRYRKLLADTIA
jgi:sugar (pentulose or hexulose) kinase